MPFDPAKPADGAEISAAELRDQFTALKALIDAVPSGPPGPPGAVSQEQLAFAIGGTARDPTGVQPSGLTISDPPTQAEMEALRDVVFALVNAVKRQV